MFVRANTEGDKRSDYIHMCACIHVHHIHIMYTGNISERINAERHTRDTPSEYDMYIYVYV